MSDIGPPYVGRSLLRREDRRLLTGQGQFIADLVLPRELNIERANTQAAAVHWAKHLDVAYRVKPETFGDPSGAEAGISSPAMRTSRAAEEMSYFRERIVAGGSNGLRLR